MTDPKISSLYRVQSFFQVHNGATSSANLLRVPTDVAPTGRLIISGTGILFLFGFH